MMFWQLLIRCLCLALLSSGVVQAQFDEKQLQSLFMTVEQREQVDDIRNGTEKTIINEASARVEKFKKITVTGFVKRSNGKNVVWLNGGNTLKSNFSQGVQVQTNSINTLGQVTVIVDDKRLKLKPGESWSKTNLP